MPIDCTGYLQGDKSTQAKTVPLTGNMFAVNIWSDIMKFTHVSSSWSQKGKFRNCHVLEIYTVGSR